MIEFMLGHMMKKLPLDQYMKCISIIHRIICYQKRNSVRLCYNWKDLWSSLITLLKFLMTYEHQLSQDMNIYDLGIQVSMVKLKTYQKRCITKYNILYTSFEYIHVLISYCSTDCKYI